MTGGCPSCGVEQPIGEWTGPRPWAFDHLGSEFWNWPALSEAFVDDMASHLPGRVRVVRTSL